MDGGSTSSKAVLIDYDTGELLKKSYMLSKGNPIADTKEILAGLEAVRHRPGRDPGGEGLRRHRLRRRRAQGVGQVGHQHRRDRRPHDVGDALLRRHRRHLRHRRAGHQGPVHAERRHQELPPVEPVLGRQRHAAAGDGRSVRRQGHRLRRRRVRGQAVAQVQLRLRGVPRLGPRQLPEGGLLEGGAARRAWRRCCRRTSGSTSSRSRAWRSWARSSCSRAGRSTTWPRSRRRSTTSRRAFPAPRSTSTRTPARRARSAPRWRPAASSRARGSRRSSASTPRSTCKFKAVNDESTRCHFCPNNCARTFIDTETPDGRTSRYISGFSCEKGTVESEEAMIALTKERKKLMKEFPNLVDYESKQVFRHFYDPEPMPEATHDDQRHEGREGVPRTWAPRRPSSSATSSARRPRRGRRAARCASASPRC